MALPHNPRPALPRVPEFATAREVSEYLRGLNKAVAEQLTKHVSVNQPISGLLLVSPSNKIYMLKVNDAGVVSTELLHSP